MADDINDDDIQLLGELGVDIDRVSTGGRTAKDLRIIAGFEEIQRFVEEHGRLPQHGENGDIFERLYAVRLDRIRESAECRSVLTGMDPRGLLSPIPEPRNGCVEETQPDDALLAALGVPLGPDADVTRLVHVRPRGEIKAPEEIAQRNPCKDFAVFQALFEKIQRELDSGERLTLPYKDNAETKKGDLFIMDGQKVLVAEMRDQFVSDYGRPDRRLRVVYDNGTESDLLLRSLQRALNKDKASRRITDPTFGPLFSESISRGDLPAGSIYILRSKSDHPFIAQHRSVIHKIGVTGADVKSRIANASNDPTYLLADVEIVAVFRLANIDRVLLESLLHKFFDSARLKLELQDRFGVPVEPREWFLVPLPIIEQAINNIIQGTIGNFRYDRDNARMVELSC